MLFKAHISIYFPMLYEQKNIDQTRQCAERFVLMTSQILGVKCQSSLFVWHPDDAAGGFGYPQYGVVFDLEREVIHAKNVYNLSKIYEGITGYVDSMRKDFDHAAFELR